MTRRKQDLFLPARTPAFVSREVGAAELGISPETWDHWVDMGTLPSPSSGFPSSTPRWKWTDVEAWLAGKAEETAEDPFIAGARRMKDGPSQNKKSGTP
jgi:hypothetical protein